MPRRAADLLVDCLSAHGVDRVFCVPGESYLAVLDALHDSNAIETIVCRHESGAGFMAVGDAKLTAKPGVAFVSRGPGATNASIAVHVAEQDAVPLVLFVGQVPRSEIGRKSFQEVDYGKTFADMAKGVYVIQDAARVPEIVARAFVEAQAPTPGPVVVVLPEDMLEDSTDSPAVEPAPVPNAGPASPADIEDIAARIAKAERPLLMAGGIGLGTPRGRKALLAALGGASPAGGADVQAAGLLPQHASQLCGPPGLQDPEAGRRALPGGRPHHRRRHAADRGDHAGLHAAGLARAGAAAGPHPRRSAPDRPQLRSEQGPGRRPDRGAGGAGPQARQGAVRSAPPGSRSSTSRSRRR